MEQGGTRHDGEEYDASVAPSPTLHHTLHGDGTAPLPRREAGRRGAALEGRLNPFHAGAVPPPAKRHSRPTLFTAVHPHVQRKLTRYVHKVIVAMFGLRRDSLELAAAYLALPAVQQRLGAFFGDPGRCQLSSAATACSHLARPRAHLSL